MIKQCDNHRLLLCKLNAYGISYEACNLIKSYLCQRLQRVKVASARSQWQTRTTRTPAFCDTPSRPTITHTWLPIHIRSQVKRRQSQSYTFLKIAKNSNFEILQETLHATHFLKLLDKTYKYEIDPTRTVGAVGFRSWYWWWVDQTCVPCEIPWRFYRWQLEL